MATEKYLDQNLKKVIDTRISSEEEDNFDIYEELENVLKDLGLTTSDAGGKVTFNGMDPIVNSRIRLGTGGSIGLMADAIAATKIWRMRGGKGQDLSINVAQGLERLGISKSFLERLNGLPGEIPDVLLTISLIHFFKTKDDRFVLPENIIPKLRDKMQGLLGVNNTPQSVAEGISKYTADELEEMGEKAGIVMGKVRTLEEFMETDLYQNYLKDNPLVKIEKIADGEPEPLSQDPATPLEGVRALGMGHVIAGAGLGRQLASHGADVLNIWRYNDYEEEAIYMSADVGMRSSRINYKSPEGLQQVKDLLKDADIFFANRRPGLMKELGLTAEEAAKIRPGLIYINSSLHGEEGPWVNRPGFDQVAGAVTGMMTFEGSAEDPKIPSINVVNDYLVSFLGAAGVMAALARRATEGGSYKVSVSLDGVSLWMLSTGIFDQKYVDEVAGKKPGHEEMKPILFQADTAMGAYQGYTSQVNMPETPESYSPVLVHRGSSQPVWKPKKQEFKMNFKL